MQKESEHNSINKKVVIILILILSLGVWLRFYDLSKESFWNDELSTWRRSNYKSIQDVIDKGIRPDVHPPGYQIIIYFVEKYIGDSEFILRLPSVISGILSILVMFLVGNQLYSHREGLISAALMAVSSLSISYSQQARSYSILLLFTLLATYFWISILKSLKQGSRPPYYITLGYIITATASSYLHYFGLYLIALHGLGTLLFFIRKPKELLYVFLLYLSVTIAYLPWLSTMWGHLNKGTPWIELHKNIFLYLFSFFYFTFDPVPDPLLSFILVLYVFLLCHIFYKIFNTKSYKDIRNLLLSSDSLVLLWLIVPFLGVYIKSILSTPVLTFRNLIISAPAAYILLSRAITQLPIKLKSKGFITIVLIGMLLFNFIYVDCYYSGIANEQFREAVSFIVDHDRLYKDSLIIGYAYNKEYFNYYFKKQGSKRRVDIMGGQIEYIPQVAKMIEDKNPQYVWYIHGGHMIPDDDFIDFLIKRLTPICSKGFLGTEVLLFENRQP